MIDIGEGRLDGIELLRDLSLDERRSLAQRCAWRHIPAGAVIVARDGEDRDVLFIVEGRVRVTDVTARGREVAYADIGAGGHVGELAAIDGGPRSANVVAVTDCLVATLPATAFRAVLGRHPDLALALLADIARMVRLADLRITELSTLGAVERLCRELLRRARLAGDGDLVVDELPTQETLAAILGTTRETVGKIMGQLAHARLVRRRRRALHLLDVEGLRGFAGMIATSSGQDRTKPIAADRAPERLPA